MNYIHAKRPVAPHIVDFGTITFDKVTQEPTMHGFSTHRGTDNRSVEIVALSLVIKHLQDYLSTLTKETK